MPNDVSRTPSGGIDRTETRSLIASNKVEGTAVYNLQKEHLGKIHNFMVDKVSGQVDYAVMSFGGILGMGDSYHPIPWKMLQYDTNLGGYVVDIDRRQLEGAPSFFDDASVNWVDPAYGRRVDEYYGYGTGV